MTTREDQQVRYWPTQKAYDLVLAATDAIPVYVVTIGTPNGPGVLEVSSLLGPDVAARRALVTAMALGWGEPDELTVDEVEGP